MAINIEDTGKQYNYNHLEPYQWKPGESGNPSGRPKESVSLVTKLRQYLTTHPTEANQVIESMVKQGKLGNMIATKEMLDRIDGKVAETHRIEGELPIRLVFVPAQELLVAKSKAESQAPELLEGTVYEVLEPEQLIEGEATEVK